MPDIKVYTPEDLVKNAADHITALISENLKTPFRIALSGGSTPKSLFELLSTLEYQTRIPWDRIELYWGDERCVPPDHPDSNYRMTQESLLNHIQVPAKSIYRIRGEAEPDDAAHEYNKIVSKFIPADPFDLVLLGMGPDGHTASLFPYTSALDEKVKYVVSNYVEKMKSNRITLTYPAINSARNIMFMVSGAGEADMLKNILYGEFDPKQYPSQSINPDKGVLTWFVDEHAASKLT